MLTAILTNLGKWLLEKLAAFVARFFRKKAAGQAEAARADKAIKGLKEATTLEEREKAEADLLNG